jgi:MFS family permease
MSSDSVRSFQSTASSIKPPALPPNENGTSPLANIGIQGQGLMMFVTCFSSIGCFLFGYDQGVMSGIITGPYFKSYFKNPTSYEIGTMVAILEIGALVTSLACGTLADTFGRKKVMFFGAITFTVGGTIQTFTNGFPSMVVGRIIAGFGVGALR